MNTAPPPPFSLCLGARANIPGGWLKDPEAPCWEQEAGLPHGTKLLEPGGPGSDPQLLRKTRLIPWAEVLVSSQAIGGDKVDITRGDRHPARRHTWSGCSGWTHQYLLASRETYSHPSFIRQSPRSYRALGALLGTRQVTKTDKNPYAPRPRLACVGGWHAWVARPIKHLPSAGVMILGF